MSKVSLEITQGALWECASGVINLIYGCSVNSSNSGCCYTVNDTDYNLSLFVDNSISSGYYWSITFNDHRRIFGNIYSLLEFMKTIKATTQVGPVAPSQQTQQTQPFNPLDWLMAKDSSQKD